MLYRLGRARVQFGRSAEEGAILVVWAVALVALLGLTAMAIDLGNIAQTKQHAVNAAQDAVLSAVVDLAPSANGMTTLTAETNAVADAEAYLNRNYNTDVQGQPLNFSDPACSLPSRVIPWPTATCIGFFTTGSGVVNGMAVALPRQVKYTLGQAAGLHSQGVGAVAFASIQTASKNAILPFGYDSDSVSGLQCIQDFSNKDKVTSSSCNGFTTGTGNRGEMTSPRYNILTNPSQANCSSGSNDPCMMANIDLGIDHELTDTGSVAICDATSILPPCTADNASPPHTGANYANPQTGNNLNNAVGPLFDGFCFDKLSLDKGQCGSHSYCWLQPRFNHVDGYTPSSASCSTTAQTPTGPVLSNSNETFSSSVPLNGLHISKFVVGTPAYSACASLLPTPPAPNSGALPFNVLPIDYGGITPSTNVWYSYDQCLSSQIQNAALTCSTVTHVCGSSIFDEVNNPIEPSPRFGIVPVYSGGGTQPEQITDFMGVYLDLAFPSSGSGGQVAGLAAWVFPLGLISGTSSSGVGIGGYYGGDYVTNLCAYGVNC